jgi:hypothetical protein
MKPDINRPTTYWNPAHNLLALSSTSRSLLAASPSCLGHHHPAVVVVRCDRLHCSNWGGGLHCSRQGDHCSKGRSSLFQGQKDRSNPQHPHHQSPPSSSVATAIRYTATIDYRTTPPCTFPLNYNTHRYLYPSLTGKPIFIHIPILCRG